MLRIKPLLAALVVVSTSYAVSLNQLVQELKENSPLLKQKDLQVLIEKHKTKTVSSERFGEIDAFGIYNRYEDKRVLYPISPPINPRNLVGAKNQLIGKISYSVPLFTGFALENRVKIGKLKETIAKLDYKLTKNQLIFNLHSLYYTLLSLQKQKKALEVYKQSLDVLYEDVKTAVSVGKKPETDLYKIDYDREKVKAGIKKLESSIQTVEAAIQELVGKKIDFSKVEEPKQQFSEKILQVSADINNLDKLNKVRQLKKIVQSKEKIAKSNYYPKAFLSASAQRNMGADTYKDLWNIKLTLKYDLFDFGKRNHQLLEAKLEEKQVNLKEKQVLLHIKKQLTEAIEKIKSANEEVKAAKKQLKFAEIVEEAEKTKYQQGISDLYNYLYAKAQKFLAESNLYKAYYNREIAVSYLKYILEEYKDE